MSNELVMKRYMQMYTQRIASTQWDAEPPSGVHEDFRRAERLLSHKALDIVFKEIERRFKAERIDREARRRIEVMKQEREMAERKQKFEDAVQKRMQELLNH